MDHYVTVLKKSALGMLTGLRQPKKAGKKSKGKAVAKKKSKEEEEKKEGE